MQFRSNVCVLSSIIVLSLTGCTTLSTSLACPNDLYIHLLPTDFNAHFNRSAIESITAAICRQEVHVIRLVVNCVTITTTAQHILHTLNTNCMTAAVKVMYAMEFRKLSESLHRFERSAFVFVLADVAQFSAQLFNRRLEAKEFQYYFVVVDGLVDDRADPSRQWLRTMFDAFWQKQVLNVVVIFNAGDGLRWFTYTPFADHGVDLIAIDATTAELFYDRLNNVGRSEIVIAMNRDEVRAVPQTDFEKNGFSGVDGMVAEIIREKYING